MDRRAARVMRANAGGAVWGGGRLLGLATIAAALAVIALAASSAGATVSVGPVQSVAGTSVLSGVACSDAQDCLGVGSTTANAGALVPITGGAAGTAVSVSGGTASGVAELQGVACVAGSGCLAVGQGSPHHVVVGVLLPITGAVAGSVASVSGTDNLLGVACQGAGACVSVGVNSAQDEGIAVAVGGGVSGTDLGTAQDVPGSAYLFAVSCPATGSCFATGYDSLVPGDTTPNEGVVEPLTVAGVPGTAVPVAGTSELEGIACADSTHCFAVGTTTGGSKEGVVVPITGGVVGTPVPVPGSAILSGIACSDSADCFAVGAGQSTTSVVVPIAGGVVQSPVNVAGSEQFNGYPRIACSSPVNCVVVGQIGVGAVVALQISGTVGPPTTAITTPVSGSTYPAHDPSNPMFEYACQAPSSAATLASCVGTVTSGSGPGVTVTDGQAIDTTTLGSFTLTVTATDSDGQTATAMSQYTVVVSAQTITFPQPGPFKYGQGPVTLTASASSGLPVAYSVNTGPCTLDGSTLTFTNGYGSCEVAADQAGDTDYDPAPEVTDTITINAPIPPTCTSQAVEAPDSTAVVITLGCTDAVGDAGDPLSIAITTPPAQGTLSAVNQGTDEVIYTPDGPYGGPDSFTFDATNQQGVSNDANVSITVTPQPAPDSAGPPGVSGSPLVVGQTLSCSPGTWSGGLPQTYAYQWRRDGTAIAGANSPLYVVQAADQTHTLACAVIATNAGGSATATSAGVAIPATPPPPATLTPPASAAPPVISGTVAVGRTLSCSTGAWSGTTPQTYTYRWARDGVPVASATTATYRVAAADAGHHLTCTVTATNGAGSVSAQSSAVALAPPNAFTLATATATKTGALTFKLDAPSPGRFTASATFPAQKTTAKQASTTAKASPIIYGRATLAVTKAGAKTLTIRPTKEATSLLKKYGKLRVTISIRFTPTGGSARSKTASLTVRRG